MNQKTSYFCIVGAGEKYGNGHILRVLHLKNELSRYNLNMQISTGTSEWKKYSTIILDQRDEAFPSELIKKREGHTLIAIDNRGAGRQQADFIWDTLPHPEMNGHELKNALRRLILSSHLTSQKSQADEALIIQPAGCRVTPEVLYRGTAGHSMTFLPQAQVDKHTALKPALSEPQYLLELQQQYIDKMKNENLVSTYFGQSLFEAIYLGKKIRLYDISPYHRKLSRWFIQKWSGFFKPGFYIDGKGLSRLVKFLIQF